MSKGSGVSRSECGERSSTELGRKLQRIRPWVQTAFLGVWLAPLSRWVGGIPSCVFHCYSCPLASFACPVGVAANYAALFPALFEIPYLLLGVLVLAGIAVGSLACGWACPFGFLQDLLGKVTAWKIALPGWAGHLRYVVLVGLVLLLPMVLGARGIPYERQVISICRLCPAGALEAGLPYSIQSLVAGEGWLMSWFKTAILVAFLVGAMVVYRPWCRLFCPLGGWLAIFNRWSLFHLRFEARACVECNLCRSRCPVGVHVDQAVNVPGCIRCLECTTCGAIRPALALPRGPALERVPEDRRP
ncbi:MAG: 4Fe-4S binding protein [Verrucomicrobia bacterium]|nr:4Fe-4S binding protein [Verrucomicrobiota bacterium]